MKSINEILGNSFKSENKILDTLDIENEYIKEDQIYCKRCNEPRTLDISFRAGNLTKVRCICKCQAEELKRKEEIERQKEKQQRINSLRLNSLLGEKYRDVNFNNTDISDPDFKKIYDRCRKYCEVANEVKKRGIGIYLYGEKGVGKTRLTSCIANELMMEYYTTLFTNFSEISKQIRSTFNGRGSEAQFLDKLNAVDFLFIDDFGTEMVSRNNEDLWLQEKIFDVINKRYNDNKPIIFTSNYSLIEMIQKRGLADKTVDRINEMCEVMKLEGKSYRQKAKSEREKLF